MAGDGFALVGDAAGFLDPFYSPGLDWLAFTSASAVALIRAQRAGEPLAGRLARQRRDFRRSYRRWFTAIYQDKYDYLGEFDLVRTAFRLDLGLHYLGIVSQPNWRGKEALLEPYFRTPPSPPFYHLMRFYNRRLAALGRARRAREVLGRRNRGRAFQFGRYSLSPSARPRCSGQRPFGAGWS